MTLVQTYNRIAHDYAEDHKDDRWGYDLIDEMISHIPKDAEILDAGCGPGYECAYMARQGYSVMGVDFSAAMIREARKRHPGLSFVVMDMTALKFPENSFDAIICRSVLHHMPKSQTAAILRKLAATAKRDGWLYLSVKGGTGESFETESDYGYVYRRYYTYFLVNELKKLFEDVDLAVVKSAVVSGANANRVQLLARKT